MESIKCIFFAVQIGKKSFKHTQQKSESKVNYSMPTVSYDPFGSGRRNDSKAKHKLNCATLSPLPLKFECYFHSEFLSANLI